MNAQLFKRTGALFIFILKKDWLKLILWLLACLSLVFIGVFAYTELYTAQAEREAMAVALANPAMEALFGRMIGEDNYTVGAMYSHTMTLMGFLLFSIQSILLVVRHTRSEEEDGRIEMLQALPIGRLSQPTATLGVLFLFNSVLALGSTTILLLMGDTSMSVEGAVLTGVIYGLIGLIFGSIALVTAQLSQSGRGAMLLAFVALGLSYVLRIIGDSGLPFLSQLSPLGLLYGTEPFVSNNWGPVLLASLGVFVLLALAIYLRHSRDLGSGILPDRAGKSQASAFLKTPFGFAFRLFQTPFVVWSVSLVILAISYGSVVGDVEGLLDANELAGQFLGMDDASSLTEQFIQMISGLLAIVACIPVLQAFLRIRSEEKKGRLDKIIAGTHSRVKIMGTFFGLGLLTSVWMHVLQVLAFSGFSVSVEPALSFRDSVLAGLLYLPAIWLVGGLASVLIGWLPQATSAIWSYLGFAFVVLYFGEVFNFPNWLQSLSAFHHIPDLFSDGMRWLPLILTTLLSLLLSFIGFLGFHKRDIQS